MAQPKEKRCTKVISDPFPVHGWGNENCQTNIFMLRQICKSFAIVFIGIIIISMLLCYYVGTTHAANQWSTPDELFQETVDKQQVIDNQAQKIHDLEAQIDVLQKNNIWLMTTKFVCQNLYTDKNLKVYHF